MRSHSLFVCTLIGDSWASRNKRLNWLNFLLLCVYICQNGRPYTCDFFCRQLENNHCELFFLHVGISWYFRSLWKQFYPFRIHRWLYIGHDLSEHFTLSAKILAEQVETERGKNRAGLPEFNRTMNHFSWSSIARHATVKPVYNTEWIVPNMCVHDACAPSRGIYAFLSVFSRLFSLHSFAMNFYSKHWLFHGIVFEYIFRFFSYIYDEHEL